jgi:hypothetical protein
MENKEAPWHKHKPVVVPMLLGLIAALILVVWPMTWGFMLLCWLALAICGIWLICILFSKITRTVMVIIVTILLFFGGFNRVDEQWRKDHASAVARKTVIEDSKITLAPTIPPKNSQEKSNKGDASVKGQPPQIPDFQKLFGKEFSTLMRMGSDRKLGIRRGTEEIIITISEKEYLDFGANSKFLGYFIPLSSPSDAYEVCKYLPDLYKTTMDELESKGTIKSGNMAESRQTSSKDLIFAGRIYIYHENDFSLQELATLERLYDSKGLSVVFRGKAYLLSMWGSVNK